MWWSGTKGPEGPGGRGDSAPNLPTPPASPLTPISSSVGIAKSIVDPAAYFHLYGFPGPVHDIARRSEYVSCFDRRTRNPGWVIEHITKQSLALEDGDRKNSTFMEDTAVPAKFRASLRDYFRSGYDRGHQAPAADAKFSQEAMNETFYLTNMSPQVGSGFNRDYWAHFEDFVRRLVGKYDSVRIVTGPLYLPKRFPDGKYRVSYEVIGNPPNIAVPTHFFKLIIGEQAGQDPAVGAFVLPNEPIANTTPLKSFYVPLESVERAAGVEFINERLLPLARRKDLCREVQCDIVVREFDKMKVKALPKQ